MYGMKKEIHKQQLNNNYGYKEEVLETKDERKERRTKEKKFKLQYTPSKRGGDHAGKNITCRGRY